MILINSDENGLGKPKWMRKLTLKNAVKMAVAPHSLVLKKHPKPHRPLHRQQPPYRPSLRGNYPFEPDGLGLGKSKKGFKKLLKKVSLKNTIKVVKFAGPLVAGIIPGGGTAMKVLDSKVGKTVMKAAKSKLVKKGVKLAKSKIGKAVIGQVRAKIEGVNQIEPKGFAETTAMESTAKESTTANTSETEKEPVGELTPVKQVESAIEKIETPVTQKKDNTMLYAIGAVAVIGGIYMATKKQ